ncbi:MAG: hypothetical protein J6I65_03710 [Lachnospiraceae bacterium]|nr:hypothetical protein [Lachnospiraceae bacterium]
MLILCTEKTAKNPYVIPFTDLKITSLEELCYYVYNNVYNINEDFFQSSLIVWIRDEIGHTVLAEKLQELLADKAPSMKDIVVTLLCSTDYYKEEEIRKLITVLDDISKLPHYERRKMKIDTLLLEGQYGKAAAAYKKLLGGSMAVNFTPEEYGNILHNLAIAQFYVAGFDESARNFKEAYVRNSNLESLHQYLFVLLLQGKEKEFESEAVSLGVPYDKISDLQEQFENVGQKVEETTFDDAFVWQCKIDLRKAFAL